MVPACLSGAMNERRASLHEPAASDAASIAGPSAPAGLLRGAPGRKTWRFQPIGSVLGLSSNLRSLPKEMELQVKRVTAFAILCAATALAVSGLASAKAGPRLVRSGHAGPL